MSTDSLAGDCPFWPPPVREAIQRYVELRSSVRRLHHSLEHRDRLRRLRPKHSKPRGGYGPLPGEVDTYAELHRHKQERRRAAPAVDSPWMRLLDAEDDLEFAVRRCRRALEVVRALLPKVAGPMGDQLQPAEQRWTWKAMDELAQLGRLLRILEGEDAPSDDGGHLPRELARLDVSIGECLRDLKRVVGIDAGHQGTLNVGQEGSGSVAGRINAAINARGRARGGSGRGQPVSGRTVSHAPRAGGTTATRPKPRQEQRPRAKADLVRELLSGKQPFEGTKAELAAEVGYTHQASLTRIKNFDYLWSENERKLAARRAEGQRRMLRSNNH